MHSDPESLAAFGPGDVRRWVKGGNVMKMKTLKSIVRTSAIVVFLICLYTFLLGNKVFDNNFDNDPIAWYFLAKGIFCSLSLFLSVDILEAIRELKSQNNSRPSG